VPLEKTEEALEIALNNHAKARERFNLPLRPPRHEDVVKCKLCAAECVMQEGELGFCGIRRAERGKIKSISTTDKALLH